MTIMTNSFSYSEKDFKQLMANFLAISSNQVEYSTSFGCGESPTDDNSKDHDWEISKEEIFRQHDDLWRELAKH